MTEDEAKTKWCPFARPDQSVAFKGANFSRKGDCIASACMAWRWDWSAPFRVTNKDGTVWYSGTDKLNPDLYAAIESKCVDGHCGLASRPLGAA